MAEHKNWLNCTWWFLLFFVLQDISRIRSTSLIRLVAHFESASLYVSSQSIWTKLSLLLNILILSRMVPLTLFLVDMHAVEGQIWHFQWLLRYLCLHSIPSNRLSYFVFSVRNVAPLQSKFSFEFLCQWKLNNFDGNTDNTGRNLPSYSGPWIK